MPSYIHQTRRHDIAGEILAYLEEHPDASDTLDGIVQWWMLEREIACETAKIKKALAELVEAGSVLELKQRNLETRYRVNPRKGG